MAQTVPAPAGPTAPLLSPDAAYEQALRPFDATRKAMSNWSDTEVSAFAVAIKNAGTACLARKPEQFTGDALISYARLCSLGQKWDLMGVAGGLYIDSDDKAKPQLATAYAYKRESKLHAQDVTEILAVEKSMLQDVPYDLISDVVTNEALAFLQLAYTKEALTVHTMREPLLLAEMKAGKPTVPLHVLYGDGLAMAALEQYAGDPDAAKATVSELEAAVGRGLTPDDAIPMAAARARYELLGKKLPTIHYELSLEDVKAKPHINTDLGTATSLLLFPDWCAMCVRMAPDLWDVVTRLGPQEIRTYGLVAEKTPDKAAMLAAQMKPMGTPAAPVSTAAAAPKSASELLLQTMTLVVPPETLETFTAEDFPFLVVVDHAGIVRFADAVPEDALGPGGFLDRVATHVAEQWPPPAHGGQR